MNMQARPPNPAGGFVLAGGASRRMGQDKALLEIKGEPLFLRAANLLKIYVSPVMLLGAPDQYARYGFPILQDRWPGRGPLAALLTGLERSVCEWNIFLACDLPFLPREFIELLLRRVQKSDFDAVVPQTNCRWQPLCAAYRQTCVPKITEALEKGRSGVIDVLPELRVDVITGEQVAASGLSDEIFENVNTPEDWQNVLFRIQARSSK
ncbi:MAG TPA: molybdenum cofactor guanylyltransferase [Terriglobia bacterium]|nr:molybdenum cofactor guanylyltransferase [Terriglobia bacterium]